MNYIRNIGFSLWIAILSGGAQSLTIGSAWAQNSERTSILVLAPKTDATEEIINELTNQVPKAYKLIKKIVSKQSTSADIEQLIEKHSPKAIVVLNNATVQLYREYQKSSKKVRHPAAVMALTSFLDFEVKGVKNATGIYYEIPAVLSFVNFRSLVNEPMKRFGVIYRERFESIVERDRVFAKDEGIEIIGVKIKSDEANVHRSVKRGIKKLIYEDGIDALWVLNDNKLLKKDLLLAAWYPSLQKCNKPVIVGVPSLISEKFEFGTFAVLPDHVSMGAQLAGLLMELEEAGWNTEDFPLHQPQSVQKVLNYKLASKVGTVRAEVLQELDIVYGANQNGEEPTIGKFNTDIYFSYDMASGKYNKDGKQQDFQEGVSSTTILLDLSLGYTFTTGANQFKTKLGIPFVIKAASMAGMEHSKYGLGDINLTGGYAYKFSEVVTAGVDLRVKLATGTKAKGIEPGTGNGMDHFGPGLTLAWAPVAGLGLAMDGGMLMTLKSEADDIFYGNFYANYTFSDLTPKLGVHFFKYGEMSEAMSITGELAYALTNSLAIRVALGTRQISSGLGLPIGFILSAKGLTTGMSFGVGLNADF